MDDYEILNKIGDGTFGTVYRCKRRKRKLKSSADLDAPSSSIGQDLDAIDANKHKINDQHEDDEDIDDNDDDDSIVAIKKMKKKYYNWDDCMKSREIQILKKLSHENIVLLKEVIRSNNNLYLVFEHMENNLHQLIRDRSLKFPESSIVTIIYQIAQGLAYIHKHKYFHRDIKPENILCRNGTECIKIADFGLTRETNSQPPYTEYVATRWYRAPELLLRSTSYNWTVDIWALGCVTGELYILRPIFPGRSEIDQIFKLCQTLGTPSSQAWPDGQRLASLVQFNFPNIVHLKLANLINGCSDNGLNLIGSMLKWNPNERPTVKEILKHRFFENR